MLASKIAIRSGRTLCFWLEYVYDLAYGFNYIRDIEVTHSRIERQRYDSLEFMEGDRKILWFETILVTIVRMQVDRNEVDAGANHAASQSLNELVARNGQLIEV